MMKDWELRLGICDSKISVHSDDGRLFEILHRLWEPFVTAQSGDADIEVEIARRPREQWAMRFDKEAPIGIGNLWAMLIDVRNEIIQRVTVKSRSVVALHAATVARDGHALLLIGEPWSGKTTFALQFAGRGWSYLSDDVAPIEHVSGYVQPFPKPIAVKTKSWKEMAYLWDPLPLGLPPPSRYFLVPATRLLKAGMERATPRWLAFLHYDAESRPDIRPLSPASALARCMQHARRPDARALQTLGEVSTRSQAVELTYQDACAAVGSLLDELVDKKQDYENLVRAGPASGAEEAQGHGRHVGESAGSRAPRLSPQSDRRRLDEPCHPQHDDERRGRPNL